MSKPMLAMSSDFLEAFGDLPKAQQKAVRSLIRKFESDAESAGLNYEKIKRARDPGMRSVRIDQDYRAIVLKPPKGSVHMLLWADKHDAAYDWATRHECRINPETGALQIYQPAIATRTSDESASTSAKEGSLTGPFARLKDRELQRLGVPTVMVDEVRGVSDESELDAVQSRLPADAYESLFLYLAGETYERLVLDREYVEERVDIDDFGTALTRLDSRAKFVVIDDDLALEAMLDAPLEKWRVFLHPSQRRLVERNWNGPVRVLGGAGTGKTVVAMHRARWLARHFPGRGKILFTTFTRNLALDIEQNLRGICTIEELRRIEVINLDRWANEFLRERNYEFTVQYGRHRDSWQHALDQKDTSLPFPDAFYDDEWEQVIQANGITTEEAYRRVSRAGRGTRLNRAQRVQVWRVFEEYRSQLAEQGLKEQDDAYSDAVNLATEEAQELGYDAVIVDEAQDMGAQPYRLLRCIVPEGKNDLFVVGDGHQRIYSRNKVVLGRCGINIRGRSRKLRINYRTTEETRQWAAALLEGREIDDLDGGEDDNKAFKSLTHGPVPQIEGFADRAEQNRFIIRYVQTLEGDANATRNVCVVAPTTAERDAIAADLKAAGLSAFILEPRTVDTADENGVRVATMARVKGLEFERVVIASMNDGLVPHAKALEGKGDEVERTAAETEQRSLVYVAATRARRDLLILYYGKASPFMGRNISNN